MNLEELKLRHQKEVDIAAETFPGNIPALAISPKPGKDFKICFNIGLEIGLDLIRAGEIQCFNSGVNVFPAQNGQTALKFYILLNRLQHGREEPPDFSFLYSSPKPHLEKVLDEEIFNAQEGGVFLEVGSKDGITCSHSRFFSQFRRWIGICTEEYETPYSQLIKNRTDTSSANFFGRLVSKDKTNFQNFLTYNDLLSRYNLKHVDWLNIIWTRSPEEVFSDFDDDQKMPTIITLKYSNFAHPPSLWRDKLKPYGYFLKKVYFDYLVFVKQR